MKTKLNKMRNTKTSWLKHVGTRVKIYCEDSAWDGAGELLEPYVIKVTNKGENISKSQIGGTHSEETKRKMRIARINHILKKNAGIAPRYNKNAIEFFQKIEKLFDFNGIFATKGGEFYIRELGSFLDYYEPNLNLVIEYDEKKHYNVDGTLKNKDLIRMNGIISLLKCKFYRFNEETEELKLHE
jgi:hypothetical protein